MTREEFNKFGFGPGMFALYKEDKRNPEPDAYPITAVNFYEALLELRCKDGDFIWVRCESIDLVKL